MQKAVRTRVEETRSGITKKAQACGFEYYITVNFYTNHEPAEVFIAIAKHGSTMSGFAKVIAVLLSVALQSGIGWEVLYKKLTKFRFDPQDLPEHTSLVSAMAETIDEAIKTRIEMEGEEK